MAWEDTGQEVGLTDEELNKLGKTSSSQEQGLTDEQLGALEKTKPTTTGRGWLATLRPGGYNEFAKAANVVTAARLGAAPSQIKQIQESTGEYNPALDPLLGSFLKTTTMGAIGWERPAPETAPERLGEAAGSFLGFAAGAPGAVGGLVGKTVGKAVPKAIGVINKIAPAESAVGKAVNTLIKSPIASIASKRAGETLSKEFVGDVASRAVQIGVEKGVGLGTSGVLQDLGEIKDVKTGLSKFGSYALMGEIFGAAGLVDIPKYPIISQMIRQVGGRALLKLSGHEGLSSESLKPENLANTAFNELLNTFFLAHGSSPKAVFSGEMKEETARGIINSLERTARPTQEEVSKAGGNAKWIQEKAREASSAVIGKTAAQTDIATKGQGEQAPEVGQPQTAQKPVKIDVWETEPANGLPHAARKWESQIFNTVRSVMPIRDETDTLTVVEAVYDKLAKANFVPPADKPIEQALSAFVNRVARNTAIDFQRHWDAIGYEAPMQPLGARGLEGKTGASVGAVSAPERGIEDETADIPGAESWANTNMPGWKDYRGPGGLGENPEDIMIRREAKPVRLTVNGLAAKYDIPVSDVKMLIRLGEGASQETVAQEFGTTRKAVERKLDYLRSKIGAREAPKRSAADLLGVGGRPTVEEEFWEGITPSRPRAAETPTGEIEYLPAEGAVSHAGEGGWSPEATNRQVRYFVYDTATKGIRPLVGVDAVDYAPRPSEVVYQVNANTGKTELSSVGSFATAPKTTPQAPEGIVPEGASTERRTQAGKEKRAMYDRVFSGKGTPEENYQVLSDLANDSMTGLQDHRMFQIKTEGGERKEGYSYGVADLNNLKKTNDTLGHKAGDALIKKYGDLIKESVPEGIDAFRYGGDEFVFFGPTEKVNEFMGKLHSSAKNNFIDAPYGVGETFDSADRSMYTMKEESKKSGRETPYVTELGQAAQLGLKPGPSIEEELRVADLLSRGQKVDKDILKKYPKLAEYAYSKEGKAAERIRKFINKDFPVERLANVAMERGVTLKDSENPKLLSRSNLSVEGKINKMFDSGVYDFDENGNVLMISKTGGIRSIVKRLSENIVKDSTLSNELKSAVKNHLSMMADPLDVYLQVKNESIKSSMKAPEERTAHDLAIIDTAKRLDSLAGGALKTAYQELSHYQADILVYAIRKGLYSVEQAKKLIAESPAFLDFNERLKEVAPKRPYGVEQKQRVEQVAGERKSVKLPKEMLPSTSEDPYTISNLYRRLGAVVKAADMNGLRRSVAALSEVAPDKIHQIGPNEEVPPNTITVNYFENGESKKMSVEKPIYEALSGLSSGQVGWVVRVLKRGASWLQKGATAHPGFVVKNAIRDQFDAKLQTKIGFRPAIDIPAALADIMGKSAVYDEYLKSGSAHAGLANLSWEKAQTEYQKLLKKGMSAKEAVNPLFYLSQASKAVEEATRLAVYKKARENGESALKAGLTAAESTVDFRVKGAEMGKYSGMVAFLNAGIQSPIRFAKAMEEDPVGTSIKGLALITIPSLVLWAINKDNPNYQNKKDWEKNLFWLVPVSKDRFIKIPKPFLPGQLFGSLPERFMNWAYNHGDFDKESAAMFKSGTEAILPVSGDFLTAWLPTAIKPLIENASNWSGFRETELFPDWKKELPPSEQYGPYTSKTLIAATRQLGKAGETLGISPAKTQNLIEGLTGGTGKHALSLVDKILGAAGVLPKDVIGQKEKLPDLTDWPILQEFLTRPTYQMQSQVLTDFYKNNNKYSARFKTAQGLINEGKAWSAQGILSKNAKQYYLFSSAANSISNMRKAMDAIMRDKSLTNDEKKRRIEAISKSIIATARRANESVGD